MSRRKKNTSVSVLVIMVILALAAWSLFVYLVIFASGKSLSTGVLHPISLPRIDPNRSFSIVALPDTQIYSASFPDIFCKQTEWIVANKSKLNIVFVAGMGDIVNDGGTNLGEWEVASRCLGKLDGLLPYSAIPGNHDLTVPHDKSSGFSAFNTYFPVSRFEKYPWYKGYFQGNQNNYEIITADGVKLMFINLEIEPSDQVIAWATSIVRAHPDIYTIVTTHKYLPYPGSGSLRDTSLAFSKDGNTGQQIWDKLVNPNCSIAMVLNGHYHIPTDKAVSLPAQAGENKITTADICGRGVNQVLQDYQSLPNGGNGWLRLYVFTPSTKKIEAYTYSPYLNVADGDPSSRFNLSM